VNRRVYIETYGCQMNVRDSELLGGLLEEAGGEIVAGPEEADVILLNTCAVRERAEERVIGRVHQLSAVQRSRGSRLGIVGCMAQHLRERLFESLPTLDFIIGPDAYRDLPATVLSESDEPQVLCRTDADELYDGLPGRREPDAVTAFVTIMRGCDRMCTFCIVPFTRGRERSRAVDSIVAEIDELVSRGVREVTLLGQTVNAWSDNGLTFGGLLRRVGETGLDRIRFTSPHPLYFSEDELAALAEVPAVCESVHLPMQSGSSRILERMNRGYDRERYLAIATRLRQEIPELSLSTDLITGFPGETEEDFAETLSAMQICAFDASYQFKYSPRSGTYAARKLQDDVPADLKQERLEQVIAYQRDLTARSQKRLIGRTIEVLIDGRGHRGREQWTGRTRGARTVVLDSSDDLRGRLVDVVVEDAGVWTLRGRLSERSAT